MTQGHEGWAVVTGASSGIGRDIAVRLAQEGFDLVLVARSRKGLLATAKEAAGCGVQAKVFELDLCTESAPDILLEYLEVHGITPAVLINNAGFGAFGPATDMKSETLSRMIGLNIRALTILAVRVAELMQERGRGMIMNVASTGAFQPCPYLGVYGASKSYVLSFSEALHEELAGTGVTVTALCPGPTRTNFGVAAGLEADSPFDRMSAASEEVASQAVEGMMAGRAVVVTGKLNWLMTVASRFLPRSVVRKIAAAALVRMK